MGSLQARWQRQKAHVEVYSTSVQPFKQLMNQAFGDRTGASVFALKYHLFNHLVTDLKKFGNMDLLNAVPFENFNLFTKVAYK